MSRFCHACHKTESERKSESASSSRTPVLPSNIVISLSCSLSLSFSLFTIILMISLFLGTIFKLCASASDIATICIFSFCRSVKSFLHGKITFIPCCRQTKLLTHAHSCMFGTFLCNSARERIESRANDAASVWALLAAPAYRNSLYCQQNEVRLVFS